MTAPSMAYMIWRQLRTGEGDLSSGCTLAEMNCLLVFGLSCAIRFARPDELGIHLVER